MSKTVTELEYAPHIHENEDSQLFRKKWDAAFQQVRKDQPEDADSLLDTGFRNGIQKAGEDGLRAVQELTTSVKEIKAAFSSIGDVLHGFDLGANAAGTNNGTSALNIQWKCFHKTFNTLLNKSHENATNAMAVLINFNDLFPGGKNITAEDYGYIKIEVKNLIKSIGEDSTDAFEIEQGFSTLSREIHQFEDTIEHAETVHRSHVSDELKKARKAIAKLREQLSEVKSEMRNAGLACVASLSAGAISAAFLFFTLSPTAAHALVTAVLAVVPSAIVFKDKIEEKRDLKARLKIAEEEFAKRSEQNVLISKYHAILSGTKTDMESLCMKIDAISGIWQALKADLQTFHAHLSKAAGEDIEYTPFIKKKIERSREVYKKLVLLLDAYVKGVEVVESDDNVD